MQNLQPMTDLLFGEGAQQRPSVISIHDLQRWFDQKQKNAAYKARNIWPEIGVGFVFSWIACLFGPIRRLLAYWTEIFEVEMTSGISS